VGRRFGAPAPDRLWVADITYCRTFSGFCYAAFVIDCFARRIVGWQLARHLRAELALDALEMAIWTRRNALDGLVHHTDRGGQGGFKWSLQHLDEEELRWEQADVEEQIVPGVLRCARPVARRSGAVSIDSASGKRSPVGCRARTPGWRRVCLRR
jgi:hypothetical protein